MACAQSHKVTKCSKSTGVHVKCCLQKTCQNGRISKITVYTDLDT